MQEGERLVRDAVSPATGREAHPDRFRVDRAIGGGGGEDGDSMISVSRDPESAEGSAVGLQDYS